MKFLAVRTVRAITLLVACLVAAPLTGHADEGFWPFNRIPRAAIKQAYGVDPFVSSDGLVLTNHHVAMDIIQELSTAARDYVATRFLACDRSQDVRAPNLELVVLQSIEDVTGRVRFSATGTARR